MSRRTSTPAPESVEALRQQVADARTEIARLASEARDTDKPNAAELRQKIADRVNALFEERRDRMRLSLLRAANGASLHTLLDVGAAEGPAGLLVLLIGPDVIVSAVGRLIPEDLEGRPSAPERAALLAEIARQSLAAEHAEETAIRRLEELGVHAPRRADADPRAVLAD